MSARPREAGNAAAGDAMGLLPDYSNQARTYDETRAASGSVVARLLDALADAPGTRLADIGGGTGNYAQALADHGFDPLVVDRSRAMLARARAKGLETLEADAERLPLADASFAAATMISMLHHVERPERAIAEAKRILAPGGRLAVKGYFREDIADLWLMDYFPSTRPWMEATHLPLADVIRRLPGATRTEIVFTDLEDASLAALAARPELILEERWRRQTSYFERLEREDPAGLAAGLRRLAEDVAAGRAPARAGRASVLAWVKPV
jgi:ubiquinone/menaquinone biosynthesis C-methylase UbiE